MRMALLSPLPPEQTELADYAGQFRAAVNQSGIEVLTPLAGQRPLTTLAAAQAWVAERDWRRIDVVHAELGIGRRSEFLTLCALARLPQRPALSATVHDPERMVWRPVNRLWAAVEDFSWAPPALRQTVAALSAPHTLWAERRLARSLDGVVALTSHGAARFASHMGLDPNRVTCIPRGTFDLPPSVFPPLSPIKLLYFGAIQPAKGLEDLIDALGKVRADHPDLSEAITLTIAGCAPALAARQVNPGYEGSLRARAESLSVSTQIEWVEDVDPRDITHLLPAHHALVIPAHESRGWALMGRLLSTTSEEAWAIASGRGLITSDARGFAEEVKQGNGASYPQGDVVALADRLYALLEDPTQLTDWANRAGDMARNRVWPQTGQAFAGYFQAVCRRAGR